MDLLIVLAALIILYILSQNNQTENFSEHTGTFCTSCYNKTRNACNKCFNCGILKDEFGNERCVGGDVHGPYNFEETPCSSWEYLKNNNYTWEHNDPWSYMLKRQGRPRRCSDGPDNATRALGLRGL